MKKQRNLLTLPQRGNSDINIITYYKNKSNYKNNNYTYLLNLLTYLTYLTYLLNLLTYLLNLLNYLTYLTYLPT